MAKKRKETFAGKADTFGNKSKSEEMTLQELREELRTMEKMLGKDRFNKMLVNAIRKVAKAEEFEGGSSDYDEALEDDFGADPVTISEWGRTHPGGLVCGSDSYYADLANHLCRLIGSYTIQVKHPDEFARELGRVLAAYMEDIVSGTRVFSAMRRVCKQRYGYRLPFYDCEHPDYMPDHINEEDIRFLIWKTVCYMGKEEDKTYSPLAPGWAILSERIFDELNDRYEDAPEAGRVTDWLQRCFRRQEYLEIREIASWLVFRNPLCYFPGFMQSINSEAKEAIDEHDMPVENLDAIIYGSIARESWQRSMSPMGCPSRTLVAALAVEFGYESLAEDIEKIKVLPSQVYSISRDKKTRKIFFESSSHEKLEVQRDSLAKNFRPGLFSFAYCSLVEYKGRYLLNGLMSGDDSFKADWERRDACLTNEQLQKWTKEWQDILDGRQVVCVAKIDTFIQKLGLPKTIGTGYPSADNYIIFISRELGIAIVPDMGYAFDIPGNRFYRKRAASKDSFGDLVFHNSIPHDVAKYIQEHNLLPEACIGASQGKEVGRRIVQNFLAFWIGFYCELPAYGDAAKYTLGEPEDSSL